MRNKYLLITIMIIIAMCSLIGCTSSTKETTTTLEKVTELNIDEAQKFRPIYWKDDENIIATMVEDDNTCGVYNINLESSKVDKINTIDNTFYSGWINDNIIPYIHNKNLWIYDAKTNSTKELYNLSDFVNEFKTEEKLESNFDIQRTLAYGVLKSSGKYIILSGSKPVSGNYEKHIKLIDSETNQVVETIQKIDNNLESIFYSKLSNKFYGFSGDDKLYSFNLENPEDVKEVSFSPGKPNIDIVVDDDGEFAYYSTLESNSRFISYDIKNNKMIELEVSNPINTEEESPKIISYLGKNIVSYEYFTGKRVNGASMSNGDRYIGRINEDKINILYKVKTKETDKASRVIYSLINKNGNKIFNAINYYSSEVDNSYEYTIEKIKQ